MKAPRSPYDTQGGIVFFPRMTDKIRLHARGELPADYHNNFGKGMDGRVCSFLGVCHADVQDQADRGLSDAELLDWCQANGHRPRAFAIELFHSFMTKRGWRDDPEIVDLLAEFKSGCGLADRDDILTFFDLFEVDEKRRP